MDQLHKLDYDDITIHESNADKATFFTRITNKHRKSGPYKA